MADYYLEWRIELEADSPEDAARKALAIQRDPESIATVFHVIADNGEDTVIDLTEIDADRDADRDNPFDPESPEGRAWRDGDHSAAEA